MTNDSVLSRAREVKHQRVLEQRYELNWRGGGDSQIVGVMELPALLNLSLQSIRSYLSTGRGSFSVERHNPVTGEPDILTVCKLASPAKPRPKRGRPPKHDRSDPRLGDPSNF